MKFQIKPNADIELLTQEELRTTLEEVASGYLRPPDRIRSPAGFLLDANGAGGPTDVYRVEAGYEFVFTRAEFTVEGYNARSPYSAGQGGIDIYVNGEWRDGYEFGGSTGNVLPATYAQSDSRAIVAYDGSVIQVAVAGGPASVGFTVNVCGILRPLRSSV